MASKGETRARAASCLNVREGPISAQSKVFLAKVMRRYFPVSTGSNPVSLFNSLVVEQRAGKVTRRYELERFRIT